MAMHIAILQTAATNERVYVDIKDLHKCFDTVHRDVIIFKYSEAGVSGKHIRALNDELENSCVHLTWNGKFGQCQHIKNGLPQGFNEAGYAYNLYTANAVAVCNQCAPLLVHGFNLAKIQFSDDGASISVNRGDAQKLINTESKELRRDNLQFNAEKGAMIKYSRSAEVRAQMDDEPPFKLGEDDIPYLPVQVLQFLGFNHNFDKLDFTKHHFDQKIHVFSGLSHVLANQLIIGAGLALSAQHKYYNGKIRSAATYGIKIIALTKKMWQQLDVLQNKYLRLMLGANATTNTATMRVIMGILPLSTFVAKLKLLFYHDALRRPDNVWHAVIRANYLEYYGLLQANKGEQKGIPGQYRYPSRDFVSTLRFLGMADKFTDVSQIPLEKKEWRTIINRRIKHRYGEDLREFERTDGWLLKQLTQKEHPIRSNAKPYKGLLKNIAALMGKEDPSTNDIKSIATLLLDSTRLSWHDTSSEGPNSTSKTSRQRAAQRLVDSVTCRFCRHARGAYNVHLLYDCAHFDDIRPEHMKRGLRTDMTKEERSEWRRFAAVVQSKCKCRV
jgi:hypothetical protein